MNKELFSCNNIKDPFVKKQLAGAHTLKNLATSLFCLPNIHPKQGLESPPQFVAVTKNTIVPMLTAPSMNCGMSVMQTSLQKEDFSPEFLEIFAKNLRKHVPPRLNKFRMMLQWLGIRKQQFSPYDLTKTELESFFKEGARAAVKKYHLPETEREHIEYGGSLLNEQEQSSIKLNRLVPRSSYANGRHEMGYNFGGNHFLELHYIETIKDEKTAAQWGLKENQLVFFYHGGGGHATYHLGRYFGNRVKNSRKEKFILFFLKISFHFLSLEGLRYFKERWAYYFSRKPFPEIHIDSSEGKRAFDSIKISLNYGYGFRVALLKRIIDALTDTIPGKNPRASFIWDASHNSIVEETMNEKRCLVHRQDAMRVFTGRPVMVAGLPDTLSYLGVGGKNAVSSFHSVTPSAAKTIESMRKRSQTQTELDYVTLRSKRKYEHIEQIPHQNSDGLFAVVNVFEKEDIIQPVAYLRPLATIKGH